MFESITFSSQYKNTQDNPLDIGRLIEAMFFYKKVIVIADFSIMKQLFQYFGIENLLLLLNEDLLAINYTESGIGVMSNTIGTLSTHDFTTWLSPKFNYQKIIRDLCVDSTGKSGKGRRIANVLESKIGVLEHNPIILEGARFSTLDQNYINLATKSILKELCKDTLDTSKYYFNTSKTVNGIEIDTNIDFEAINLRFRKFTSLNDPLFSQAYILTHILNMEAELYFSSSNFSELSSSQLSADLASQKINYIIEKSNKSKHEIGDFSDLIFDNSKAIQEAVNSKSIDLSAIIKALIKSKKFKDWVSKIEPDHNLLKDYHREITKETIFDKLPVKSVRWVILTGLGVAIDSFIPSNIGTITGLTLSALDAFYIDKIISGWKPNHFIENEMKKLIKN
jgi:hypothetical protein